jgi:Leucine-rich repeat (LRR) protein
MFDCQLGKPQKRCTKMKKIEGLVTLNLSHNPGIFENFKDWPVVISDSLRELYLSHCSLPSLPAAPSLEILDISENPDLQIDLAGDHLRTLIVSGCSSIGKLHLPSLVRLDISSLTTRGQWLESLEQSQIPSLEVLLADQNEMKADQLTHLFSMESLRNLKVLSVKHNKIETVIAPDYDPFSGKVMSLQVLDLTGNSRVRQRIKKANKFLSTTIIIYLMSKKPPDDEFTPPSLALAASGKHWVRDFVDAPLLDLKFNNGHQIITSPNES